MAEDVQGMDPVAWLNRDDMRTEFALEDGGTITSSEIVERMRMAYECSKDFSGPVSAIDSVAYALASGDPGYTGPHLSESAVKALANRTAHDDGERERFMARLKLDSDDYTPLSEILTDNRTYRNLHAVAWLVAREGWEAAQNL
nr:MAG TPA: hypothetical protein [Caudoviricetes sp.]